MDLALLMLPKSTPLLCNWANNALAAPNPFDFCSFKTISIAVKNGHKSATLLPHRQVGTSGAWAASNKNHPKNNRKLPAKRLLQFQKPETEIRLTMRRRVIVVFSTFRSNFSSTHCALYMHVHQQNDNGILHKCRLRLPWTCIALFIHEHRSLAGTIIRYDTLLVTR